jgi:hypothetical protein
MKIFPNETKFCGMTIQQAIQIAELYEDDFDWDFWDYIARHYKELDVVTFDEVSTRNK